jgi:photosystem II stability/assembly factor-like uncharacterized protein
VRRFLARLLAIAALGSGVLAAQTGRPGSVLDLVPDPNSPSTLYASTQGGGVFRSDDTGRTWGARSIVPGGDVFQLVAARSAGPTILLLAATADGIWRSDDRGLTWVRSDSGLPPPPGGRVAVSPTDSAVLYAAASPRLGRSLDMARSWVVADESAGLPPIFVTSVGSAADPRIAYAAVREGTQSRSAREGIYKTADGGATWVQTGFQPALSSIHYADALFVDPASSDRVFALSVACGFSCGFTSTVRSDDGGATWTGAAMLPSTADARGALYSGGLRSTDHGATLQPLRVTGQLVLRTFASAASSTIVGQVESGDLFSSTDSGETWLPVAPPGLPCGADADQLCLASGRFRARVLFITSDTRAEARAFPLTADAGAFWFFTQNNLELVVKVVSGEAVNGHWWVFVGGLTDVEYYLEIVDTVTGARWDRHNDAGNLQSVADTEAF